MKPIIFQTGLYQETKSSVLDTIYYYYYTFPYENNSLCLIWSISL